MFGWDEGLPLVYYTTHDVARHGERQGIGNGGFGSEVQIRDMGL